MKNWTKKLKKQLLMGVLVLSLGSLCPPLCKAQEASASAISLAHSSQTTENLVFSKRSGKWLRRKFYQQYLTLLENREYKMLKTLLIKKLNFRLGEIENAPITLESQIAEAKINELTARLQSLRLEIQRVENLLKNDSKANPGLSPEMARVFKQLRGNQTQDDN